MGVWTERVFAEAARRTNLGDQTLEACRRVLVPHQLANGTVGVEKGVDVAKDMGLFPAQISRALSGLRAKYVEMVDMSEEAFRETKTTARIERESSRDVAVEKARELFGEGLIIRDVRRGETYIGKPLFKTPLHLVQSTGIREAVIHDLAKLQRVPDMTFPMLEVKYPSKGGLAEVQETQPGQVRGGRSR